MRYKIKIQCIVITFRKKSHRKPIIIKNNTLTHININYKKIYIMKRTHFISKIQIAVLTLMTSFSALWANAQEKASDLKVDVNVNKGDSSADWMSNPIVWVAGALILILIVALAARGGGSKA